MRDISEAKDPDLRASVAAMQRAAELARKTAIQTGTDLIVVRNGKLTRIPPNVLIEERSGSPVPTLPIDHTTRLAHLQPMVLSTQQITDAALHLPERERLGIAAAIWRSLGGNEEALADLDACARAHELDSGAVSPKSQQEVFANARAALG